MSQTIDNTLLCGWRFDGRTSAKETVTLRIKDGQEVFMVDHRSQTSAVDPHTLRLSELFAHAPLLVHFPDGSHVELADAGHAHAALHQAGAQTAASNSMAAVLARDWRMAVAALVFLISMVAAFYVWLLPSAADFGAQMVPSSWNEFIGQKVLHQLDDSLFTPTDLSSQQRQQIQQRFDQLNRGDKTPYELHFRHFKRGPNAIALPGNHIVLTDELVNLVDGDLDVLAGVLAHELGHLKHKHGLRMVIQTSALTLLGSALIGDYSSILASAPALIGQLHYSREFETQADTHSHQLLCAQGMEPAKTALFFERMQDKQDQAAQLIPIYLSSHPDSVKRAQFYRSPC